MHERRDEDCPAMSLVTAAALSGLSMFLLFAKCMLISSVLAASFREEGNRVHTDLPGFGPIFGTKEKSLRGNAYYAFRGLPYSKAGRFEDFVAPTPWTEPRNAANFGRSCVSVSNSPLSPSWSSEDCLYANVYTTNNMNSSEPNAPVLVFLHGGGFISLDGTPNPVYFMDHKIVVVTINYRLGPFGFLFSYDPIANFTGNYGLKDQIHALRWVQRTIAGFGGNPKDVTLYGVGSGAASVHWLMLCPHETEGLFHKAITMSGSALCPWAVQKNPSKIAGKFAQVIGCLQQKSNWKNNPAAYRCIRETNADLMSKMWFHQFAIWAGHPYTFVPAIDGTLIKGHPDLLLQQGSFLRIPWLASVVRDEGSLIAGNAFQDPAMAMNMNTIWMDICPLVMEMGALPPEAAEMACELARERYMGLGMITPLSYHSFMKMTGDMHFNVPMQKSAEHHSKHAPFFGYRYDYYSPVRAQSSNKYIRPNPMGTRGVYSVVSHGDDSMQVMPLKGSSNKVVEGDPDEFVHKLLLEMYMSFIQTGEPKLPSNLGPQLVVQLPGFSPTSLNNILVVDKSLSFHTNFSTPDDVEFWTSLGLG